MNVLVITETCFGNTARIADGVTASLRSRGATVAVADAVSAPTLDSVAR